MLGIFNQIVFKDRNNLYESFKWYEWFYQQLFNLLLFCDLSNKHDQTEPLVAHTGLDQTTIVGSYAIYMAVRKKCPPVERVGSCTGGRVCPFNDQRDCVWSTWRTFYYNMFSWKKQFISDIVLLYWSRREQRCAKSMFQITYLFCLFHVIITRFETNS